MRLIRHGRCWINAFRFLKKHTDKFRRKGHSNQIFELMTSQQRRCNIQMYTSKTQTSNCLIPSPHLVSEPVFCTYTVYLYFFYDFLCAYLPRHIYMSIRSLICYIVFSTSLSLYVRVVIYMYMICHKFVSIYPSILICVPTTPTYVSFNLHICYCNVDNPRIHPCIHLPIHQPVNPRIYLSIYLSI